MLAVDVFCARVTSAKLSALIGVGIGLTEQAAEVSDNINHG